MANGRCRMHGGKSTGAPPEKMRGNKNAVKTGEYETIWLDALDDEERVLFYSVQTDVLKQLDQEIRLLELRERRMLKRIKDVMDGWEDDEIETKYERVAKKEKIPVFNEDGQLSITTQTINEMVEKERTEKKRSKLERIVAIEEALTRVQREKSRLIELKHRIERVTVQDDGSLDALAEAIRLSAERLAGDRQ